MKGIKRSLLAGVALFIILVAGLNYWDVFYGRYIAHSFFSSLTKGNFEDASGNVDFYRNDGSDIIETDTVRQTWAERVQDLKNKGVYIVSYKNLTVKNDDSSPVGKITITVMENGRMNDYHLAFYFGSKLFDFGITRVIKLEDPNQITEWEKALSGEL